MDPIIYCSKQKLLIVLVTKSVSAVLRVQKIKWVLNHHLEIGSIWCISLQTPCKLGDLPWLPSPPPCHVLGEAHPTSFFFFFLGKWKNDPSSGVKPLRGAEFGATLPAECRRNSHPRLFNAGQALNEIWAPCGTTLLVAPKALEK